MFLLTLSLFFLRSYFILSSLFFLSWIILLGLGLMLGLGSGFTTFSISETTILGLDLGLGFRVSADLYLWLNLFNFLLPTECELREDSSLKLVHIFFYELNGISWLFFYTDTLNEIYWSFSGTISCNTDSELY